MHVCERWCCSPKADLIDGKWMAQSKDKAEAAAAGGGKGGGMFRGLVDTVIGNLRLSITNVHIRYEARRLGAILRLARPRMRAGKVVTCHRPCFGRVGSVWH